jgi:hypothetical protein
MTNLTSAQEDVQDFPVLKGSYLGQKPPGRLLISENLLTPRMWKLHPVEQYELPSFREVLTKNGKLPG